mmetsp:Transcript_13561/g.20246  ORF Transcript_13561/g.20246 Transcript_13561/m.20246 type:complete len:269 (-) Transcript_13561:67-873(-)
MRVTSLALAVAVTTGSASAFSTNSVSSSRRNSQVVLNANADRRAVLSSIFSATTATLSFGTIANAGLLDDYGTDPLDNKQPTKKEVVQARDKGKPESNLEPNLRSNYYYPTNKVRYLPRIKKCNDAIPGVAVAIGNEDWEAVRNFATVVADDTILPLKLYVSSLGGGGTNVKVGFAKNMTTAAKQFEKNQALLVKAVDKKDGAKSSAALEQMAEALLTYRTEGRLLGPDGGGDIPSVDEIRRSTKRFRGEAFEAKIKERDARVAAGQQ